MVASAKRMTGLAKGQLPRWAGPAVLLVLAGMVAGLAVNWPKISGNAHLGAAYGAHIACSCHFIEGRSLDDCRKDFEPGMGLVTLSADEAGKSVTARVLPIASETATWRPGAGCQLGPWR